MHILCNVVYKVKKINMVIFFIISSLFIFITLIAFFTVEQQSNYLIERFGKFVRIAYPGLNIKIPIIEQIGGKVNLRIMQLNVEVETKTLDNVFVKIVTAVQYKILADKIYQAFYILDNPESQIQAFVFDVIRAKVPKIKLDDLFSRKDEIANAVKEELKELMNEFGYDIVKGLVTDINPDPKVKIAMNEINEAQRLRVAAMERAEAEKILKVKQAEAEAESKILQGKGVAGQRQAILDGLQKSLDNFKQTTIKDNISTIDVMSLILMVQYFDTLKDIGTHGKMSTILIPHSPSALQDLCQQIRNSVITAAQVPNSTEIT